MSEERGTAQQREQGAYGRWQASRHADDPDRAAAFDLGCDCHYLEGDSHHGIGCPAYPSDCPECGAHPGNQDEICRKAISTRKATINVLQVEGGGEIKACTMCGHRLEQCGCFLGMRPIDTSKLEFRNTPDSEWAAMPPPGWELSGAQIDRVREEMRKSGPNSVTVMNLDTGDVVSRSTPASRAADSRARVTLLMDRDDCVRGVYASQGQAEAERDKRNDDPSCTDSPYSTKTWNVDDTADSVPQCRTIDMCTCGHMRASHEDPGGCVIRVCSCRLWTPVPQPPAGIAADSQAAGGELPAKDPGRCNRCGWPLVDDTSKGCTPGNCSMRPLPPVRTEKVGPTSDEWLEAIVPILTEKHNEAVRLRVALERIYALLSSTGATPEADRTLSIEAANIANAALRWKP